jgi:hypothetical protein
MMLADVGAEEDENGHDVKLTSLFATTFHKAAPTDVGFLRTVTVR